MRLLKIIFFVANLFLSFLAFSANPVANPTPSQQEQMLTKIVTNPAFQTEYENCKKQTAKPLQDCLKEAWTDLGAEKQQKIIDDITPQNEKNSKTIGYESVETTGVGLNELSEKSPHQKAIEEYLENELNKALYGEGGPLKKNGTLADHAIFYDLYKSALGKSVIASLSAFCYEACDLNGLEPDKFPYLSKTQNCRKTNLENLSKFTKETSTGWNKCILSISKWCLDKQKPDSNANEKNEKPYTIQQACVITDRIKALRQDIIATDKIKDDYKELGKKGGSLNFNSVDKIEIYDPTKKKSIDDLTSMASGNLNKALEDKESNADIETKKQQIKKCKEIVDSNGGKATDPACEGLFLSAEKGKELEEDLNKERAGVVAIEGKIKTVETKEDLTKLLADVGRTDTASIDSMIQEKMKEFSTDEKGAIIKIRTEIADRYTAEKEQVIKDIAEKLTEKTATSSSGQQNKTYLEKISTELNSKAGDLTSFLHFNNIVSGFLNISSGDAKDQTTNYQSIKRELDDSVFLDKKKADEAGYNFAKLQENIGKTPQSGSSGSKDAINLEVKTLNDNIIKDY